MFGRIDTRRVLAGGIGALAFVGACATDEGSTDGASDNTDSAADPTVASESDSNADTASSSSTDDGTATSDTAAPTTGGAEEEACATMPGKSVARGRPYVTEGKLVCLGEEVYLGCTDEKCGAAEIVCRDGTAYTVDNGCVPPGFDEACENTAPPPSVEPPLCEPE